VTHLAEVALFTDDVAAVSAFYRELAGTPPAAEWPGGVVFEVGEAKFLVHERSGRAGGRSAERGPLRACGR
jgi:catechol-2,3-dioxygenase